MERPRRLGAVVPGRAECPVDGIVVSMAVNDAPFARDIYFDVDTPDEMRSVGRAHFYCRGCWSGNVWAADGDGARCL